MYYSAMTARKLLIANWKSNKSLADTQQWIGSLLKANIQVELQALSPQLELVIAPSNIFIASLQNQVATSALKVGLAAQDCSPFPLGAYTGAEAAAALVDLGASYCIIGHSERRRYFGETNNQVKEKVQAALDAGLQPVVCIDTDTLTEQFDVLGASMAQQCIIAYEPLAAIGTGFHPEANEVAAIHNQIRTLYQPRKVLYGGSVDADSALGYSTFSDGFLVGTASLQFEDFMALIRRLT